MEQFFSGSQTGFGELLRSWRKHRKYSQMELALDSGISARHLSFLETGRSRPGRDTVTRLARQLQLSMRESNVLLQAAGYAAEFGEMDFESGQMEEIRDALTRLITVHQPWPAVVLDGRYDILLRNSGFDRLLGLYLPPEVCRETNLLRLVFRPDGMGNCIQQWPAFAALLLQRLYGEAAASGNRDLYNLYSELQAQYQGQPLSRHPVHSGLPVATLTLCRSALMTRWFSTVTTLGTPADITAQELRIESFFPLDQATADLFKDEEGASPQR